MNKSRRDMITNVLENLKQSKFVDLDLPVSKVLDPLRQTLGSDEDTAGLHILAVDDYVLVTK